MASIVTCAGDKPEENEENGENDAAVSRPSALFRQPLALQWFEQGVKGIQKRKTGERQAGEFNGPPWFVI